MPGKTNRLSKGGATKMARSPMRSRLPFYLAGGALLLIVAGAIWLVTNGLASSRSGSTIQTAGRPAVAIDRESIDFGKVPLDVPVKATFELSNIGDQPLQILNQPVVEVKQGC